MFEETFDLIGQAAEKFTLIEAVAVTCSIIYLLLAANENIWCWLFAGVSVLLYLIICIRYRLYAESALQVFYLIMALYGWWQWRKKPPRADKRPIVIWRNHFHLALVVSGFIMTIGLGYFLQTQTDALLPYIDSFTTVFSLGATYMVTKKILENWLYWIIIDSVGIYLYFQRELYLTSILFIIYIIIALFGFVQWYRAYKKTDD
jgi:nicotinamide mononucleotide transporter